MATLPVRKTKFVDIDLNFTRHPITGDISKKVDERAIATAVKNLVQTRFFERKFHPEIYSQVNDLLFEQFTPTVKTLLERTIQNVIENFEPRVELQFVDVEEMMDQSKLRVFVEFKIVGSIETVKTEFFLERTI